MAVDYDNNVLVFRDTINKSFCTYTKDTMRGIKAAEFISDVTKIVVDKVSPKNNVVFEAGGSASTAYRYAEFSKTAVLNFADAVRPGGWVDSGAPTQEENLCRCSNLFPIIYNCQDYYEQNRRAISNYYDVYTDGAIYAKDVLFFKDDIHYSSITPRYVDVITCPSPSVLSIKADKAIYSRACGIVKLAVSRGVSTLILGAWGCGAFGQLPDVISTAFAKALLEYNHFNSVVFAIRSTDGRKTDVLNVMKKKFFEVYNG